MTALVFPGQGSQYVGMAKSLCERYPECAELAEEANQILGYSLTDIMFDGDESLLRQTRHTQPAIFLHSYLLFRFLEGYDVAMTAGHSLGEYTALCYAGALSFEDALRLVAKRGELMQQAGERIPGTMAAVIGLPEKKLLTVLEQASAHGIIQAANFNSPGQVVLSGEVPAIKAAIQIAKASGAKLAKELSVSGAFHSPLMKPAKEELARALNEVEIRDARIPVCMNVDATLTTNADEIREKLIRQLTNSVLWEQSIKEMIAHGVTEFIEVGPQRVLQGLIKRIEPAVSVYGIDTLQDVEKLCELSGVERAA
ncbi:MAG: ACP S-malonyltransferase [Chloroherpetonaceae bacterium]|nr:ACP S-malonyltransferase [Chloroherpetonaceae bacterium]MCS7211780.1 ACP S-malonyltransferase [Chloroherpetonaceae bacterium]MDW8020463.1 ACP S-malonyltransferase [Chloroherpetonaceae bacterium]